MYTHYKRTDASLLSLFVFFLCFYLFIVSTCDIRNTSKERRHSFVFCFFCGRGLQHQTPSSSWVSSSKCADTHPYNISLRKQKRGIAFTRCTYDDLWAHFSSLGPLSDMMRAKTKKRIKSFFYFCFPPPPITPSPLPPHQSFLPRVFSISKKK